MYKVILLVVFSCVSHIIFSQTESMEIDGSIIISNNDDPNPKAGTIRWTGQDFEGFNGSQWVSLTGNGTNDPAPIINLPTELQSLSLTLLFEDNFDAQDDFANGIGSPNNNGTAALHCRNGSEDACTTLPAGWDVFTSGERFHPEIIDNPSA